MNKQELSIYNPQFKLKMYEMAIQFLEVLQVKQYMNFFKSRPVTCIKFVHQLRLFIWKTEDLLIFNTRLRLFLWETEGLFHLQAFSFSLSPSLREGNLVTFQSKTKYFHLKLALSAFYGVSLNTWELDNTATHHEDQPGKQITFWENLFFLTY